VFALQESEIKVGRGVGDSGVHVWAKVDMASMMPVGLGSTTTSKQSVDWTLKPKGSAGYGKYPRTPDGGCRMKPNTWIKRLETTPVFLCVHHGVY